MSLAGGAMGGWVSVEELTQHGFAHAPVVMSNEAHNGQLRCIRTRQVGVRMVRAAHEAGVRRLAMEALPWQPGDDRARSGISRRPTGDTWPSPTCGS